MTNTALKVQEEVVEVAIEEVTDFVEEVAVDEIDELDALFSELEGELTIDEPVEEAEITEAEMIDAGNAANIEHAKMEALAELDEMSSPVPDESALVTGGVNPKRTPPKTKRIAAVGVKKSEALRTALGAKLNDYLALDVDDAALDPADFEARIEAKLNEIDSLPKKIQEKAVNFFAHLANGASLSNYTSIAMDILVKHGEISSRTLRDAYLARPYSIGTSNSQCTQLMKLIQVLNLVVNDGGKLVANPNSTLLPMFAVE